MNEEAEQEEQVEEEQEMEGKEIVAGLDEDTQWQGEESKRVNAGLFYEPSSEKACLCGLLMGSMVA